MAKDHNLEAWKKPSADLNLHNRIVGDQCVDWSQDHVIGVATSKKLILCDFAAKISSSKQSDASYHIKNVSVPEDDLKFDVIKPQKVEDFEEACAQSSNIAACPDTEIYSVSG